MSTDCLDGFLCKPDVLKYYIAHLGYSSIDDLLRDFEKLKNMAAGFGIQTYSLNECIRKLEKENAELRSQLSKPAGSVQCNVVSSKINDPLPDFGLPHYCVYEIWANGALLYIGYTRDIERRLRQHRSNDTHGLASDCPEWTVKTTWFATSRDARAEESRMIREQSGNGTLRNVDVW